MVFDFDRTILKIHAFSMKVRPEQVATRDLEADFTDLAFFRTLVEEASRCGIQLGIASFGRFPVIEAYMKIALEDQKGSSLFNGQTILTPGKFEGHNDGECMESGKNLMLERFRSSLDTFGPGCPKTGVMFFDDDKVNIELARADGWPFVFHTPDGFTTDAFKEALKQMTHKSTSMEANN